MLSHTKDTLIPHPLYPGEAAPYGLDNKTVRRPKKQVSKKSPEKTDNSSLKIRLRGKDGAPLSVAELWQGLYVD